MKQKKIHIYGKHAVREALMHARHLIQAVYLSPQMDDKDLLALIRSKGLDTQKIDPQKVSSWVEGNAPHQGIIARVSMHGLTTPFEEFIKNFKPTAETLLVYLDGVQDPHNVGTIIRASAAFGASAVLVPEHSQSPITGTVIKTSAGTAFVLPLISVPNGQQALAQLKKAGVTILGLAGEGSTSITTEKFDTPTLMVLGNEADGISGSARVLCERMVTIPIHSRVESLNVASAATAALFAWSSKHAPQK